MTPTKQGSIHLFRFAEIDVYLHWSWFIVAVFSISSRQQLYSSLVWNVGEYLALFVIVLMHEFGHSLACRQTGGQANQIVLWPLGGVAYVNPPPRPGATLWSIAAGPLVNVVLAPIFLIAWWLARSRGWSEVMPDTFQFIEAVCIMNIGLLVFNLLPVYPLDGGQILRSLLWFVVGRAKSLLIASLIGLMGVATLVCFVFWQQERFFQKENNEKILFGVMAFFLLMNGWRGLQHALMLLRVAKMPRHEGYSCPDCKNSPTRGNFWLCPGCQNGFDTFITGSICPHCGSQFAVTQCLDCGGRRPMNEWIIQGRVPPRL